MSETLTLYSFFDGDRSSKVRWTATELGIEVEEARIKPGGQQQPDYRQINPYAQIPAVVCGEETLIESTAISLVLAERHPEAGLIPGAGDERQRFWQTSMLLTQTLEKPTVNYYLGQRGILDEQWSRLVVGTLAPQLETFAGSLPQQGYLLGPQFRLADIFAAYVLKIAILGELLQREGRLANYLDLLAARPAAQQARFFDA